MLYGAEWDARFVQHDGLSYVMSLEGATLATRLLSRIAIASRVLENSFLSVAKDLLFARLESKADTSVAHPNMRNYGPCRGSRKTGAASG
jgi:hypothetical protein